MIDIAILEAAGLTADQILRVVKEQQRVDLELAAEKREKDRIRKRNQRSRPQIPMDAKDATDTLDSADKKEISPTPPKEKTLSLSSLPSSVATSSETRGRSEETVAGRDASDWPSDYRELFWRTYPNKVGKPKALAKLDAARAHGVRWVELWDGLERYVAKTDERPWCNPETWLNQERWTDEPPKTNGSGHGKRNVGADRAHELAEQVRQREFEIGFERPPRHERGR